MLLKEVLKERRKKHTGGKAYRDWNTADGRTLLTASKSRKTYSSRYLLKARAFA